MEMDTQLKSFLNDPQTQYLINNNKWEEVYIKLQETVSLKYSGEFTRLLLASEIDPLEYINYIPDFYLWDSEDITNFKIPSNITNIGIKAFAYCESLTNIIIPNSVTNICRGVFEGCSSLTNVIIPDSVIKLDSGVFNDCSSLTSLTLGKNLREISGWDVLTGTKVKSINYNNTMENWKKIDISHPNTKLFKCTIHCTDGNLKYDEELHRWIEV